MQISYKNGHDLSNFILEYLEENGIKQTFLADKIGISRQNLGVQLKRGLSLSSFKNICSVLGLDTSVLVDIQIKQ